MRYQIKTWVVSLCAVLAACASDDNFPDPGPPQQPKEIGKAQLWLTTGDQSNLLEKQSDLSVTEIVASSLPSITVD